MAIDVLTPKSPGWWMKRCYDKLDARQERLRDLYARYEGDAPVPKSLEQAPDTAQQFFKTARTGFAEMLIKATRFRVKVTGLQLGVGDAGQNNPVLWKAYKRAGMLIEGPEAIKHMLVAGDGYFIASPDAEDPSQAAVTSEDPRQVVTIHDPVRQSRVRVGAKFFHDADEGADYAYLYDFTTRRVHVAVNRRSASSTSRRATRMSRFTGKWAWDETRGGEAGREMVAGTLLERLRNDEGRGDFQGHTDLLDRIDHVILQGMVIATFQAFKQRAIKVSDEEDLPVEDEQGREIDYDELFQTAPDALWKLPATAEMWESNAVDMTPIVTMATKEIERLAAVTFTPLSMFTPEGANQSAQGASLVREGMIFKTEDRQERVAASVARVAAAIATLDADVDLDVDPFDIVVKFAPAERHSLTERYQAAVNAKSAGMPWRAVMSEVLGFSPEVIAVMETDRMSDLFLYPADPAGETGGQAQLALPPSGGQGVTEGG